MEDTSRVWWVDLVSGMLLVLLGWLVLAKPISTIITLVVFFGFYLLVVGIVDVIMSFFGIGKKGSAWGWELLAGIFAIIAGLVVLNNPLFASVLTPVMFAYIVAFALVFKGGVKMFAGKKDGNASNYIWTWGGFFLGLLYLLMGLYLLAAPRIYLVGTVVIATGWFAIIIGALSIAYSFANRSATKKVTA
jgi:uncharacterized membrane protein HdeD (DUF308 family)